MERSGPLKIKVVFFNLSGSTTNPEIRYRKEIFQTFWSLYLISLIHQKEFGNAR